MGEFFTALITAWNNLVNIFREESTFSIISFIVSVASLIVGIAATFYAYLSAKRSESLLKRLIIYPFRDLDIQIGKLLPVPLSELLKLFELTGGTRSFTLEEARKEIGSLAKQSIYTLQEDGWIIEVEKGKYKINPDRTAYLTFYIEANNQQSNRE